MPRSARTRKLRWLAPVVAAAVVALIAAIPALSAAGAPDLAPLTPAQLLAKVQQAKPVDLWGTIDLKTNLGIPNLGALGGALGGSQDNRGFDPTSLLSGSNQALVWFAQPGQARLALLGDMSEVDVVHNGTDTWTWDSTTKKVVHYTEAPESADSSAATKPPDSTTPTEPMKTPQQVADDLLARLDPSTVVSTAEATTSANQPAYQLVLTPRAPESTVDHVVIAVDSVTSMALRVQIFAKGQQTAAVDLGFGDLHYATPAASNFKFTAPSGATVTNKTLGGHGATAGNGPDQAAAGAPDSSANQPVTVGQDWTSVEIFPQAQIPAQYNEFLKAATPVSGAFGSGRLLSSQLVNLLLLDDGRVAVGAVTPAALEAAVAGAH